MKKIIVSLFITLLLAGCGQQNVKSDAPVTSTQAISEQATPIQLAKNENTNNMSDADLDALLGEDEIVEIYDPIEPFNRAMFWFNDKLYIYVLKPIAKGWRFIAPEPIRVSISDFYYNIKAPVRIVNAALQGRGKDAYDETGRFLINSTVGILGFHDVGKDHYDLPRQEIDFGTTLGHWGSGPGFYLVIPFTGPSSARDGIGSLVDFYLDPKTYLINNDEEINTNYVIIRAVDAINAVSLDKDTYEAIREQSLDPYLTVRDAYIQHREALINDHK